MCTHLVFFVFFITIVSLCIIIQINQVSSIFRKGGAFLLCPYSTQNMGQWSIFVARCKSTLPTLFLGPHIHSGLINGAKFCDTYYGGGGGTRIEGYEHTSPPSNVKHKTPYMFVVVVTVSQMTYCRLI